MAKSNKYKDLTYDSSKYKGEEDIYRRFILHKDDATNYFLACIKPRLDRSYKLYVSYNGDRAKEIKKWQSNIFVPYIHGVIETLKPRILDARPEFTAQGRTADDQLKAEKLQNLMDFNWELSKGDSVLEDTVSASMTFGTGFMYAYWKKDERELEFLKGKDVSSKKLKYSKKKVTFYDAPCVEFIDNYELLYDWHNIDWKSKQFYLRRRILTGSEIKRRYPMADEKRLAMAFNSGRGNIEDYAAVRNQVKSTKDNIRKGSSKSVGAGFLGGNDDIYNNQSDPELKMHEVFDYWLPFEDGFGVFVNDVPIMDGALNPIVYDFKEAPIIAIPFIRLPKEAEGLGIPML